MTTPKPGNPAAIPLAALKPLTTAPWRADDLSATKFAGLVESHRKADQQFGGTCQYVMRDNSADSISLTRPEAHALVAAGVLPPEFLTPSGNGINQHAAHAYDQFAAQVYRAYAELKANLASLKGTPAGRFPAGDDADL